MPSFVRLYRGVQKQIQANRPFSVILLLFVVFRLMAVLVFRPGGYLGDISTFGYYQLLIGFTGQGYYPFVDYWVEYPPLFPWIMVGLYRLSLLVPAWSEPGAWFYLFLSTFLVVCETGNLVLFYGIARRLFGQDRALHLSWIYSLLLVPVLTFFLAFDSLVLLLLLWALLLTLDRRPLGAGIAVGLGFMTKLIPVIVIPAAWRYLRHWSTRIKLIVAAATATLLVAAPFALTRPDLLAASFLSSARRASWETVWALLDGYYSFGVAGGVDRFDASQAGAAQHASQLPWTFITAGFGLFYLALYTRSAAWENRRPAVAFTALTLNVLTLYFRGYSPQFLVMLLPFVILLLPGIRGIVYALLLSAINLVEFPIFFVLLPDQHWLLTGTVLLRTLILLVTGVEYAAQTYDWQVPLRWWRRVAWAVAALTVVLGLAASIAGARAYVQSRYEANPHRAAMEIVLARAADRATLVVDDQITYEQLFPFLHRRVNVLLVEVHDYLPDWQPRLAVAARESEQLWIYAPIESPLHQWASEQLSALAEEQFNGWRLTNWQTR